MQAAAERLALWRRATGFQTVVKIMDNPTTAQVKNYIQKAYKNEALDPWGFEPKPFEKAKDLSYVLIFGDHSIIPAAPETANLPGCTPNYVTDLYYYCMDGENDILPEVRYGRFLIQTSSEAETVVSKIIDYETSCPDGTTDSFNTAFHMAQFQDDNNDGEEDRLFVYTAEHLRLELQQNSEINISPIYTYTGNLSPLYWNNDQYGYGGALPDYMKVSSFKWNANTSDIINAFNKGPLYVFYDGHGSSGNWYKPYLTSSSCAKLNNQTKLPYVFSLCCQGGPFLGQSTSRSLIINPNGGAIAVLASSVNSYSGYNDVLAYGLFRAIWSDINFKPDFKGINSNVTSNYFSNLRFGDIIESGMLYMYAYYGQGKYYQSGSTGEDYNKYMREIFNCIGDPALKIYRHSPNKKFQNNYTVNRTDNMIEVRSAETTCTAIFYNSVTGKIEKFQNTSYLRYPTEHPENYLITLLQTDCPAFVSPGLNTSITINNIKIK